MTTKRGQRRAARPHGARTLVSTAAVLLACMLVAPAAWAVNQPVLLETYPVADGAARSIDAIAITATYDRDLSELSSSISLKDKNGTVVAGSWYLSGPKYEYGGQRSISFQPAAALAETLSPYTARVVASPRVPGTDTVTTWSFAIDDTAPLAPVIDSPVAGTTTTEQPVVASGTAEPGSVVDIVENDAIIASGRTNASGTFAVTLPYEPADGVSHTIAAIANDEAGNRSATSASTTFRHDSVHQIPVIVQPSEGAFLNTASVTVAGTAKPSTTVLIYRNTALIATTPANTDGNWSRTIVFAQGTHILTARAYDGYFIDGPSAARTFTVDTTAPLAPAITTPPTDGSVVGTATVTIAGTAEPLATVELRTAGVLRATAAVDTAGTWNAAIEFTDGTHTVDARAVDRAGNAGPSASRTFVVDTVEPTAPLITTPAARAYVNTSAVAIAGRAEAGTTVRIHHGQVVLGTALVDAAGDWSTTITFSPDAAYTIRADAIDAAGHAGPFSADRSFTVDTAAPAAPTITRPFEGSTLNSGTVDVIGTAEPGAFVDVFEGTLVATTTADSSGEWSVRLTGLADGEHTLTAQARDRAGNVGPVSDPRTFTIDPTAADATAPAPPVILSPSQGQQTRAFVVVSGTAEPFSTVRVIEGYERGSTTANGSGAWQVGISFESGTHAIVATATDRAGNTSLASPARHFTVDAQRPTTTITTGDGVVFLPDQPTTIQGEATDDNALAEIVLTYYDVFGTLVLTEAADCSGCPGKSARWSHSPVLSPGTYRIEAYAVDLAGNRSPTSTIRIYRL